MTPADRKKQLIAQGRIYRAEVMLAKEELRTSLQPDSLAKNLLSQVALTAISVWRNRGAVAQSVGLNAATLLPLVMSGAAALSRNKARLKPLLRGAVIAGAVAGVVALAIRWRRQQEPAEPAPERDV